MWIPSFIKKNFVNHQQPAISAENLNDIERVLYDLDNYMANVDNKSEVMVQLHKTEGVPVATVYVNDMPYVLYMPQSSSGSGTIVGFEPTLSEGTKIGTITIDGVDIDVYAPNGGESALADLTDVDLTEVADGEVLKYDATSNKWVNGTGGGGSVGTVLTQTLVAGQTTLTFTDVAITENSLVSIYVNHAEAKPVDLDDSTAGTIVLVFNEQATDLVVKLVIE